MRVPTKTSFKLVLKYPYQLLCTGNRTCADTKVSGALNAVGPTYRFYFFCPNITKSIDLSMDVNQNLNPLLCTQTLLQKACIIY
jgi:hypothetical protein